MFNTIGKILQWIGKHFWGMLFLLIVLIVLMPEEAPTNPANLQEIKLAGPIIDSDTIVKEIEKAQDDKKIKGVLLTVNSPGGAVAPSIEISYAIKALKEKKPVIAYAGGIMASGSYYSSIYANQIIANPGAIVGSIGVIMESADVKELMDKIGIKPQIVQQGTYKQAGTPMRQWTPEERAELERLQQF
jgi:protease-4